MLLILERDNDFACEPRIHFVDPVDIDQGGAVNSQELRGIEAVFEIGDGLVDAVPASVQDRKCELVLGEKMRDVVECKKRDALADTRSDAVRIARMTLAQ